MTFFQVFLVFMGLAFVWISTKKGGDAVILFWLWVITLMFGLFIRFLFWMF